MATQLSTPFRCLTSDNFLSRGSAGHVFKISSNVVFKCPTSFKNPAVEQAEEMEESAKKLEKEKAIYEILIEHRHPNIVHGILCVSQGLFMERLEMTLDFRIAQSSTSPIDSSTQERWIQQLTGAVAWLEGLGLVHGDLRPANILLDVKDNIKVGDFDATVKSGEELVVTSEPFCKLDEDFEPPLAGPVSEQFSLGSCIYTIRFGHIPFHNLDAPNRVRKLIMNEFSSTKDDALFGDLTRKCWHGTYDSISKIADDILSQLQGHTSIKGRPLS